MTSLPQTWRTALVFLGIAFLASTCLLNAQTPPTKIFLKFAHSGESQDPEHREWVEATACVDSFSGEQGRTSESPFTPFKFYKAIDRSSPKLREAALRGTREPDVEIHFVRDTFPNFLYMRIVLWEVRVTEVSATVTTAAAQEVFSLDFDRIDMYYYPQNANGTAGTQVTFSWTRAGSPSASEISEGRSRDQRPRTRVR